MSFTRFTCFSLFVALALCKEDQSDNSLLIIIRSQNNEYHKQVALERKENLVLQAENLNANVKVLLLHEEWPVEGAWVLLPLFPDIARKYTGNYNWIMFVEEATNVNLSGFVNRVLPKYDSKKEMYFGRCLVDREVTIVHHFAFHQGGVEKFNYPDFQAGWILSNSLVKKIAQDWEGNENPDFQVDVQHEVAMFLNEKYNMKITCSEDICGTADSDKCVTWVDYEIPDCGNAISLDDVLITVKTTQMFHNSRVPIVKQTWGKYAKHIIYYSNVTDPTIPTVDCGVPNTEKGHCGKMEVIINNAYQKAELKHFPWLIIADDDSIIGLTQLVKLLNCYKPTVPLVLGERYGFGLNLAHGLGYGYITGGGSMVMSRAAINAWFEKSCKCPTIDTPDDMFLGQCFSVLVGIPVTHSPRFHQARPDDYSVGHLNDLQPVSFHKHWEVDPVQVYKKYFGDDDEAAFGSTNKQRIEEKSDASTKDEL